MAFKDEVLYDYPDAVLLTKVVNGKMQFRISPRPLKENKSPKDGYLSEWCSLYEGRAWKAAACRCSNRYLRQWKY